MSDKTQIQKKENQTEAEFFSLVNVGRKGLEEMMSKMESDIMHVAAKSVRDAGSTWTQRAIVWISNNDVIRDVISTKIGLFSVYKALSDAAIMGLQPGGIYPHFHIAKKEGKAVMVPSAEGLAFCATHGDGAVLQHEPEIIPVYDKDDFRIDMANKITLHNFEPFKDRGALVGWYAELDYINGRREIPFVTQAKVKDINEKYSMMKSSTGNLMPAWAKSEFEMWKKTAAKYLLKKAVMEAKGLAMVASNYYDEPPIEDISSRTSDRLNNQAEKMKPAETVEDIPDPEEKKAPIIGREKKEGDLF
jgi:recombinational DNA repair protein RecT